jgi:hypothetical protein
MTKDLGVITPKEAQALFERSWFSTKPWLPAVLVRVVHGKWGKWRVGEKVKARRQINSKFYTVQRERWRGSMVPLCNVISGVPKESIQFLEL